jgi:hypothetical protein
MRWLRRQLRRAFRLPAEAFAAAIVVATALVVIGGPLLAARYPLMTDLPQHAANASVLRHYFDEEWHFREQFVFQPFAVPYLLFYVVTAGFMLVLPELAAVKAGVFVLLALLPIGLSTLFWGMRKSPLLGVTGLLFCWGTLASWGFLNYLGALGLWAMVVGLSLRAVDLPARQACSRLAAPLVVLFFTHPFRFPMAVVALGIVMVLSFALRRRHRALFPVTVAALTAGVAWWFARPPEVEIALDGVGLFPARLALEGFGEHPYRALESGADETAFHFAVVMVAVLGLVLGTLRLRRRRKSTRRAWVAFGAVSSCVLLSLLAYLTLPMKMGSWWFIYPREATACAFVALALLPDLPRRPCLRVGAVLWLAAAVLPLGVLAIESHRTFDAATRDFARISARLPRAPKLLYLVFDHEGAPTKQSPFLHLPAYVQAERGGWTSFSFAWLGHSPLAYRDPSEPGAVVPPRPPDRWEWTPHRFDLLEHGAFFDWFLVRSRSAPDGLFAADPRIRRVAHEQSWWLYRRMSSDDEESGVGDLGGSNHSAVQK